MKKVAFFPRVIASEFETDLQPQDEVAVLTTGQVGFVTQVKPNKVDSEEAKYQIWVCLYHEGEKCFSPEDLYRIPNKHLLVKDALLESSASSFGLLGSKLKEVVMVS